MTADGGFAPGAEGARAAASAWDDLLWFLESILRWLTSEEMNDFLADTSLFLIFGGLAVLALIILLVLLANVFPDRARPHRKAQHGEPRRALRSTPWPVGGPPRVAPAPPAQAPDRLVRGAQAGVAGAPETVDEALDLLVARGMGEPRILSLTEDRARVRLYGCRSCDTPLERPGEPRRGCSWPLGFLEGAFESVWGARPRGREVSCRRQGMPACEFELMR